MVEVAHVNQSNTGPTAAQAAVAHGPPLEVVKFSTAKRGLVLASRRWVVERRFAWAARFRLLVRDFERLPATLAGLHFVIFAILMLEQIVLAMPHVL